MQNELKRHPGIVSLPGRVVAVVGLVLIALLAISLPAFAQDSPAFVRRVREIETDELGIANPAGLAFSPATNTFHVVEVRGPVRLPDPFSDIISIRPAGDRVGPVRVWAATADPINMSFDAHANRLLLYQSASEQLLEMAAGPGGQLDPGTPTRHDARRFGLQSPQGMTVDPASGDLFILDSTGPRIVGIEPTADGGFGEAATSQVDLAPLLSSDLHGLAFNPANGHLYVLSRAEQTLYELTQSGNVVAIRDISAFRLSDPQGMVFAPSGDQTDDPSTLSLYIADSGLGVGQERRTTSTAGGQIIELSFAIPPAPAAADSAVSLVQMIDTSLFLPPSPDPAGLTYVDSTNTLMMGDSEVNETPLFTGDNLFRVRLSGELFDTLTTLPFSNEPTGVGYNPDNGHLFFADDNRLEVFEMDPGSDGVHGTVDDVVTSFDTDAFGSNDPEGLAYARETGALFIADGLNSEVYRVTPGSDGLFNGIGDIVTSFDTAGIGITDPEGLARNRETGHLYLVGNAQDLMAETTVDGALVQMIDIAAADSWRPSGLAYGPSSLDPDVPSIWIADLGRDNNAMPGENDGKIYEMTLPPTAGSLTIVKEVEPSSAGPGDVITYTLSFSNDGNGTVAGVTITDIIPVSVTVQSVVSSGVDINDTGAIPPYVWQVQDLAPGEGGVINITAALSPTLLCGHTFTNTATIAATTGDSDPDDNSSDASVAVGRGVVVTPPGDASSADPGSDVVYTLSVNNTGSCPDTFDIGVSGNMWPVSAPATVGPVAADEGADVDITVSLPSDARCGTDFATVTFTSQSGGTVSDSSFLTTTANTIYSVTVEPPSSVASANPGAVVTHTLRVTNTGNCVDTFDLSLTGDDWPTGAPATVGPLGPGMGAGLNVTATVPAGAQFGDEDIATVTLASQGNGTIFDSSTLTSISDAVYGVEVEPPSESGSGDPGADVVYTLRVTNTGNYLDTFDLAVAGNAWSTGTPASVGPLAPGAGADVDVTVTVPQQAACGAFDSATVTFTSQGDGTTSDSSTLTTSVNTLFGVLVEPSSDTASGDPGTGVVYTLWVTNTGSCPDTFDLDLTGDNWTTEAQDTVGPLAEGQGASVDVTVTVPLQAACTDFDDATVTYISQGDGTTSAGSDITTSANAVSALSVLPSSAASSGVQGVDVVYTLWVINAGNCTDTFDGAVSGNAWTTDVPATVGPLAASGIGIAEVPVTVTIPADAQCVDDIATVTFTSQGDGTTYGSSVLTTSAEAFYGVTVEPSSDADTGDPGTDVVYSLWVTNIGNCPDTFDLAASGYTWATDAPASVGPLPGGTGASVDVAVTVPLDAQCGDGDSATVAFTSLGDDTASDSSLLTTSADAVYGVMVEPSSDADTGDPGTDVVYSLWVTNTGNCADTFDLTLTDDEWTTEAPGTVGPLAAGVGAGVGVTVSVPACSTGGTSDSSTVGFSSQNDGTASESAMLTTAANYVAPVATDDVYFLLEDTSRSVTAPGVLGNDEDANCNPLSATLEAAPVNGTVAFEADGSFVYTPTINFDGDDTFSYSASDGALSDTATVTLTVYSAGDDPIVEAGDDQSADEGETVAFAGSFIDPALRNLFAEESIHWDFGDGDTATGSLTATHEYLDNGLFTVTLAVTDTAGDVGQDSLQVTVHNVAPTANAGPDLSAVPGEPFSIIGDFTDPGLDDTHSIVWNLDDGTIIHDTLAFDHTYVDAGVYTITLTVIDDDGGEGSDAAIINAWYRQYLPLVFKAYAP